MTADQPEHPAPPPAAAGPTRARRGELAALAAVFTKLALIGFGGPAAHIALMEHEVVRRRGWLTRDEFLDLVGATNLIPGPNSTEMAMHIGQRRAGTLGLVVAGACFIIPSALLVALCAWAYVRWGHLPRVEAALYGIKPVVIAVVGQALWSLGRSALKTWMLGALAATAAAAVLAGAPEIAVIAAAGVLMAITGAAKGNTPAAAPVLAAPALPSGNAGATLAPLAAGASAAGAGIWPLFWIFLKIGSVLFGSGYVLLAFLRAEFVESRGWLTEQQLLDAVSVGQVTPGPVFTTATFIGYLLRGPAGAAAATIGIFLPAFILVALSGPLVPRIRRSRTAAAALDGVNAASWALMAVVAVALARTAIIDWLTASLAIAALAALLARRLNSAWLVIAGAAAGILLG